jgi:NAD(P)-dependent dehydrogenase (short-subunit alcohol dehydrogenase family)
MTANDSSLPVVCITGASGGIGRALANALHANGNRVVAVGRSLEALADVPAHLRICADTAQPGGAAQAIAQCKAHFGEPPSQLAHCVGSTLIAPLHRTADDALQELLRVNLSSALWTLRAWVDALRSAAMPGSAVLLSSVVARIGVANHEAIAAAKGGVEALARSAAASYAQFGIRVNGVAPGMTDTPMTASMLKIPAMREGAGKQYPLGGVQSAEQVAQTIAWLLSDASARTTGQIIAVDGGFTTIRPLVK